jgi:phosphate butyryltransferase
MHISRPFDELKLGDHAEIVRTLSRQDLVIFAHACGDMNPLHRPDGDADIDGDGAPDRYAPAAWITALMNAAIGAALPGPGSLIRSCRLDFASPASIGDAVAVKLTVVAKDAGRAVTLSVCITRADGAIVCEGEAQVIAPAVRIEAAGRLPGVLAGSQNRLEALLKACDALAPLHTAVVCPDEQNALAGALLARDRGLIAPILIGDPARITATANALGLPLGDAIITPASDPDAAAAIAVAMVLEGKAGAVMKGNLHTDELLKHVVKSVGGLRGARRISHCFVMDAPALDHLLVISDAAIAIAPTLEDKIDITQNAIDLARAIGMTTPRVGVLSAVETVNPKIPSTLDAAALSKMAERGQIKGGLVDGPLAMDNALSVSAAKTKGIAGLVAGRAEVLIAPNIEAGNILVKELTYAAGAEGGGLVVGARAPVMLTSRADDAHDRLISCALAILYAHWRQTGQSAVPA